jgi:hypothetical protein
MCIFSEIVTLYFPSRAIIYDNGTMGEYRVICGNHCQRWEMSNFLAGISSCFVVMEITVFWDVSMCRLREVYRRFGETCLKYQAFYSDAGSSMIL